MSTVLPASLGGDALIKNYVGAGTWAFIEDKFTPFGKETLAKVIRFIIDECIPAERLYHAQVSTDPAKRWKVVPEVVEQLKKKAKAQGLWNLFLSAKHYPDVGSPLTNLEYAVIAEMTGRCSHFASESLNCAAPDTGNMEVFAKYGNAQQKQTWLTPLLNGEIRSAFAMTERFIASSDATNIRTSIRQEGNEIVINGHKWWISGAGDPRCAVHLVMGKSDPKTPTRTHSRASSLCPPTRPASR